MIRLSLLALILTAAPAFGQGFKLPPGYEIAEYAGDDLAHDIINLAIDPKGRVVVTGNNYIRILVEDPKTGKANRAIEFSTEPKTGAHGLLWEGDTLYFVGDDALRMLVDKNGDDKADGPSAVIRKLRTGNDHGSHHLRRGPDGWLYLLAGDTGGITDSFAELATSPVKNPIGGTVVRFHPTSGKSEIVAHGFRNPYGFDFDARGRLYTFDSDNERCVGLPWYEPTRFCMVIDGGFYGWLSPAFSPRLWRIPPYAPDTIAPLARFGRGSPTFVVATAAKPKETEILLGDWTFGRVHRVVIDDTLGVPKETSVFLEPAATNAFAPTAAVVHPRTGDVFISTGGRGTRGAVYRIRGFRPADVLPTRPPLATEPSQDPNADVARDAKADDPLVRLRALERVGRRQPDDKPALRDDVARAALEANVISTNRLVAFAAARAWSTNRKLEIATDKNPRALRADLVARILAGDTFEPTAVLPLIESEDDELIVDGLCILQRRLDLPAEPGLQWEGYAGAVTSEIRKALSPALMRLIAKVDPEKNALKREAARTYGLLAPEEPATRIVEWLKATTHPTETIHLLASLGHSGPRLAEGETAAIAGALIDIDRQSVKFNVPRESNWPLRFGELTAMLLRRDPKLADAIVAHADFGVPEHAAIAAAVGFPREKAVPVFVKKLRDDPKYSLTGTMLVLLTETDADVADLLRARWGRDGLDEAMLPFLARKPLPLDRAKFVGGLKSLQPKAVQTCLNALAALQQPTDDDEVLNLFVAWDQAGDKQDKLVAAITERLQAVAGFALKDRAQARQWVELKLPSVAKKLALVDNVDRSAWQKRLEAVDWTKGDIDKGKAYFTKATCAACHTSTQTIGPDLAGSAGRFSRDDLFTAILQPNKEVADRYRITQIATRDGKVHNGLIVYNAFDGVILRTGPADTVRIAGNNIETRATVVRSLMPAGLLDTATDENLADLFAYLRSLKTP